MTLFHSLTFKHPVLRVNNRDLNIAFYQESLGFKLISEENAIAVFSAWQNKEASFIIEESPTYRTRAVNGTKKLAKIIVKSQDAKDIEKLLANGAQVIQVYQGQNGYAYETVSPEGDLFLLHAEDDLSQLVAIERPELEKKDDTTGLSNFAFQSISLNVPDAVKAEAFYDKVFAGKFPINLSFKEAQGQDLQIAPNETWDIEILECCVNEDTNLNDLKSTFESWGLDVYLDSKEKILVISDTSNIEIWISKE